MSNVIPFPTPSTRGYCSCCNHPITVLDVDPWPEQCPACTYSPLSIMSVPRQPVPFKIMVSGSFTQQGDAI